MRCFYSFSRGAWGDEVPPTWSEAPTKLSRFGVETSSSLLANVRINDAMFRFILRRLLQMIPLLLGITLISFVVMKMAPGDYLTEMRANPQVDPAALERLSHNFGLDRPWWIQYVL